MSLDAHVVNSSDNDNDADISNSLAEKNKMHKVSNDRRTEANKTAFLRPRCLLQWRLRERQKFWMPQASDSLLEQENNRIAEDLSVKVKILKSYAHDIRHEADQQNEVLDKLQSTMDSAGHVLGNTITSRTKMLTLLSHSVYCRIRLSHNCKFIRVISIFASPSDHPVPTVSTPKKLPTVSVILNKTMPLENALILRRWQEKMKKEMGDQGFNELMSRVKRLGKDVHQAISDLLLHKIDIPDVPEPVRGYIRSLECVLTRIASTHLVEEDCFHPILGYRGRFDSINCFQVEQGPFVLTEWKTVHESKRVTSLDKAYDAPLQVAAYIGAYNITRPPQLPEVRQGLIAYAYADGYPTDILIMGEEELEHYWTIWCNRVCAFYEQSRSVSNRGTEEQTHPY
ncbi:mitochondrial DNA repair [Sparganum proliferum]